jgi:hypothetical protein
VRRRLAVTRRALVLLVASSLLTVACARDKPHADSASASAGEVASLAATAAPAGRAGTLPGALEKPIASYSGDELYAFTHRLVFGGGAERDRKCRGHKDCEHADRAKRRHTRVRVDAVDGQDSLDVTGVPTNGVIAIRARNTGDTEEALYGFRPDKKLEYYLVVLPDTGGKAKWQLEELDTTPNARRHTQVGSGEFKGCGHKWRAGRTNRANFYSCATSPSADSLQTSGLLLQDDNSETMWMYCKLGCCIAQAQ